MMRSMLNMLTGGGSGNAGGNSNSSSLLSRKRKSSDPTQTQSKLNSSLVMDEEQTIDYTAITTNKPKLLSTLTQTQTQQVDQENDSMRSNQPLTSTLHKQATLPLMQKLAAGNANGHATGNNSTSSLAAAKGKLRPVPKEESPPKRQKLNSGASVPAPVAPLPTPLSLLVSKFELELESRVDRLRSQADFLISSLQRSFANEINKVPSKVRSMPLSHFLDVRKYGGDASVVMSEAAMNQQQQLENWVAATPALKTSRKHREMILAAPSHTTLLATMQRLTRATARKLHVAGITGLEKAAAAAAEEESKDAPTQQPLTARQQSMQPINLADAVYETPSARGRIRPRVQQTQAAATNAAAAQGLSIASIFASANKKRTATATTAPMQSPRPSPSSSPSRSSTLSCRGSAASVSAAASSRASSAAPSACPSAAVSEDEQEEEEEATTARTRKGARKGKTTRAKKTTKTTTKTTKATKAKASTAPAPAPVPAAAPAPTPEPETAQPRMTRRRAAAAAAAKISNLCA